MKAKYYLCAAALIAALPMAAQETYENAKLANEDLNGTARYVGMGGALDALGADISTMGTNPAGIGLFRHSVASVSVGMVSQSDAAKSSYVDGTNMSFDQAGFVVARQTGENSYINFGFNYHKSKNFDYILSAADKLNHASQNKITYQKLANEYLYPIASDGAVNDQKPYRTCNQLDDLYYRNLLYAANDGLAYNYDASDYSLNRGHKGYISEFDFNFSGNINDRVFLGITFGVKDVRYKSFGVYEENLVPNAENINYMAVEDERRIHGTGFDIRAGVIFRPIETSPFRIGLHVASPTFYDLTTENSTIMTDGKTRVPAGEAYDFKLYTPWKFGFSLGHTIGSMVALGASFEYSDYSNLDSRINTGEHYDWWYDTYYDESESDKEMNNHTERTLKGVSTLKLGAEVKPADDLPLAFRLGYNYVSPMYKTDGYKDGTVNSIGSYYSSATDYTNWKDTHRITAGIGYTAGPVSLDLAYQYSTTKGEFAPFMNYYDLDNPSETVATDAVDVKNNRHQLLFTIGYHF